MEENQSVQTQWVQQPNQNADQASVSMQIQELLVKQQQYQQQYNQLVDYVKQTPNLPIDQANQIQSQLNHLNTLFVEWKQKLQALWYNQVQVNKPTEVKSWSKNNFSFKKLAIGCGVVLLLILWWFVITLISLKNNPDALLWIWISAASAKTILQLFAGLIFWSIVILTLWLVVSNIYRLVTVKNQSKLKNIGWLMWGLLGVAAFGVLMWLSFTEIWKINVEEKQINYDAVQPYLVWKVSDRDNINEFFKFPYDKDGESGIAYPLIAPSEMSFMLVWAEFLRRDSENINWIKPISVTLSCGNKQWQELELSESIDSILNWAFIPFKWTCLYGEKWKYSYSINVKYKNDKWDTLTKSESIWELDFTSEIQIIQSKNRKLPSNWEFILWKAPAKISIDTTQVFRDFGLGSYNVIWDLDWDNSTDRENQVSFEFTYKIPQVYYPAVKFTDLSDFIYVFPIRVEQSDVPICDVKLENLPWTTKYNIYTEFVDNTPESNIKSYSYTILNDTTSSVIDEIKDKWNSFSYTFPEKWNYRVEANFITIDDKQWKCESDLIQLKKESFNVQYTLLLKDQTTWKYKEMCSSQSSANNNCTQISLETIPQNFQLQLTSITPSYTTTKKVVYLDDKPLFNEDDVYNFDLLEEWTFTLKIVISDSAKWIDEEIKTIKFTVKKPDIIGKLTITSPDTQKPIDEWFEPLTVILDASKTEINIPWDEIVYFTWDFGDGEIKKNQQNGVVAHTYNYNYDKETWIFTPKVTITTKLWHTKEIVSPTILNVKKWLINIELSSTSHPTRQAQVWKSVSFQAEFDGLPETMTWDFGDWTPVQSCPTRSCAEVTHTFKEVWNYSVRLTLDFDAIQKVDSVMLFKVYE